MFKKLINLQSYSETNEHEGQIMKNDNRLHLEARWRKPNFFFWLILCTFITQIIYESKNFQKYIRINAKIRLLITQIVDHYNNLLIISQHINAVQAMMIDI